MCLLRVVSGWLPGEMMGECEPLKQYFFLKNFILVVSCDDNPLTRLSDLSLSMNLEGKWLSLLTCNYCGMNKDKSRIFGWWITLYMLYTDRIYNIIIVKKKTVESGELKLWLINKLFSLKFSNRKQFNFVHIKQSSSFDEMSYPDLTVFLSLTCQKWWGCKH